MTPTAVLSDVSLALLLGGMTFFAVVVAPQVFRSLEPAAAGKFLRALFPRYYLYVAATAAAAALGLAFSSLAQATALALVSIATVGIRQRLVPRLNAWRDAQLAGDEAAGQRFARGHRLSAIVNLIQLLIVLAVVVGRA